MITQIIPISTHFVLGQSLLTVRIWTKFDRNYLSNFANRQIIQQIDRRKNTVASRVSIIEQNQWDLVAETGAF